MKTVSPVLAYINEQPKAIQASLLKIRNLILEQAPHSTECIIYNMPAFKQQQVILYFAAFKNHIGIYPTATGVLAFEKWTTEYKTSKGAIQLPYHKAIPTTLLIKLIQTRVKQIQELNSQKKKTTCQNGHKLEKKTSSHTCQICKKEAKKVFFLKELPAPAIRVLKQHHIEELDDFTKHTHASVAAFHGLGPKSMIVIEAAMKKAKLKFKS